MPGAVWRIGERSSLPRACNLRFDKGRGGEPGKGRRVKYAVESIEDPHVQVRCRLPKASWNSCGVRGERELLFMGEATSGSRRAVVS